MVRFSTRNTPWGLSRANPEAGGFPKFAREVPAIYTAMAQELASQVPELGYTPAQPARDGTPAGCRPAPRVDEGVRAHPHRLLRGAAGEGAVAP